MDASSSKKRIEKTAASTGVNAKRAAPIAQYGGEDSAGESGATITAAKMPQAEKLFPAGNIRTARTVLGEFRRLVVGL